MVTQTALHDPQVGREGKKEYFFKLRFTMLALGLALIGPLMLQAGTNTWNTYGSPIGSVMALAFEPGVPTTLFAATSDNGVQESTDGGQTWTAMNNGLPSNNVTSIAINPQNPMTMYAVTNYGLYISYDGGNSWSTCGTGLNIFWYQGWDYPFVVIDPLNPNVLYL
ncbi:MAG: WD40/YVTN/BNR-like repeat-containing protein, partial [Acidobacteriota bacterium]